jgi:putative FmdB family regulatory protein
MPIYEYRCTDCGFQDEYLQKVSEPPLADCPSCGKPAFRKLVSAAGFQLKGSGWYATDFKGGAKPAAAKSEAQGEAKPEAKTEAKPESKADAKTESKPQAAKTPAAANSDN